MCECVNLTRNKNIVKANFEKEIEKDAWLENGFELKKEKSILIGMRRTYGEHAYWCSRRHSTKLA